MSRHPQAKPLGGPVRAPRLGRCAVGQARARDAVGPCPPQPDRSAQVGPTLNPCRTSDGRRPDRSRFNKPGPALGLESQPAPGSPGKHPGGRPSPTRGAGSGPRGPTPARRQWPQPSAGTRHSPRTATATATATPSPPSAADLPDPPANVTVRSHPTHPRATFRTTPATFPHHSHALHQPPRPLPSPPPPSASHSIPSTPSTALHPHSRPSPPGGFLTLSPPAPPPPPGSAPRTHPPHLRLRRQAVNSPSPHAPSLALPPHKKFLSESLTLSQPPRTLCQQALS